MEGKDMKRASEHRGNYEIDEIHQTSLQDAILTMKVRFPL
jgi:hypothetical protein